MNVQLKDITVTARDGRVSHLDQVYIRGSHVRFFIVPDMLRYVSLVITTPLSIFSQTWLSCLVQKHDFQLHAFRIFADLAYYRNAPMFRSRGQRGRGVGLARGKATVQRARAGGRGR